MTILNLEKTTNHLSAWIKDYFNKAGIKYGILYLSGDVESALVALLLKKTGIPLLCYNFITNENVSTRDGIPYENYYLISDFVKNYDLTYQIIDLDNVFESLFIEMKKATFPVITSMETSRASRAWELHSHGNLLSNALHYMADAYKGIVLGTVTRTENKILRNFSKFGVKGTVDINPIADLYKQEVNELFIYLAEQMNKFSTDNDIIKYDQFNDTLVFPADDIEWADRNCSSIIFSDLDPVKTPDFYKYTTHQQKIITKLYVIEKQTRHKINNIPICNIRQIEGLVK